MPRNTKSTKTAKRSTKSSKSATTKRSTKTVKAAAAPTPAPVETPAVAPVEQPVSVFAEQFSRLSELSQKLQDSFSTGKSFVTEIRRLASVLTRYEKKLSSKKRTRRNTGRTTLSGITRPVLISDELCSFLGQKKGSLLARTVVTKHITTYIREHNLQNPDNKKQIIPDAKLQRLLMPLREQDRESGYTFFNLQHYIKHNYKKTDAATSAKAVKAAAGASA